MALYDFNRYSFLCLTGNCSTCSRNAWLGTLPWEMPITPLKGVGLCGAIAHSICGLWFPLLAWEWREEFGESEPLRGLLIQSETRASATQTFLIRLLHQLSHLCHFPFVIGSKSHGVRRASVHTFAEGDQQGKEGACATWQPDFSDRDKQKIYKAYEK